MRFSYDLIIKKDSSIRTINVKGIDYRICSDVGKVKTYTSKERYRSIRSGVIRKLKRLQILDNCEVVSKS